MPNAGAEKFPSHLLLQSELGKMAGNGARQQKKQQIFFRLTCLTCLTNPHIKKYLLAPWRVLCIDKCGALTRAAAKHTPRKSKQRNDRKTKPKARRRGAVPAEACVS